MVIRGTDQFAESIPGEFPGIFFTMCFALQENYWKKFK